jgi:hypothetical protein
MECNFKCPITGKLFHIPNWKSKYVNGDIFYYQTGPGWRQLTNSENGEPLIKIDSGVIHPTSVHTETAISK